MRFRHGEQVRDVDAEDGSRLFCSVALLRRCRICLEEEEADEERSSAAMEAPCACSGTLQFAHRGCIQRWCDEKGSTLCEICLQSFQPGYTVASRRETVDVNVAIRGDLDALGQGPRESPARRFNVSSRDEEIGLTAQADAEPFPRSALASERTVKFSRSIVTAFTAILLVKNFILVMSLGAQDDALTLLAVFGLRASGILLPMLLIIKVITTIQNLQRNYRQQNLYENRVSPPGTRRRSSTQTAPCQPS